MTALEEMFNRLIKAGCGRGEALDKLAVKLDVDRATIARTLSRAATHNRQKTRP